MYFRAAVGHVTSDDYRESFQVLECLYPWTGSVYRRTSCCIDIPGPGKTVCMVKIVHRSLVSTLSVDDRLPLLSAVHSTRDLADTPPPGRGTPARRFITARPDWR